MQIIACHQSPYSWIHRGFFLLLFAFTAFSVSGQSVDHWETILQPGNLCTYLVPQSPVPSGWADTAFDDSSWTEGAGGVGYGDGDDNVVIDPALSVYCRYDFTVDSLQFIEELILDIDFDDGFVAYLNGVEVARFNMGSEGSGTSWDQNAADHHNAVLFDGGIPERFILDDLHLANLISGTNLLALEVHNIDIGSSDLSSNVYLHAGINSSQNFFSPTPDWFYESSGLDSTLLPLVLIDTRGQVIPDEPRIVAHMGLIYNGEGNYNAPGDPFNNYDGQIAIERRGRSSQGFDKKSYRIETQTDSGTNNNVSLLGMPKENDWVLNGPYSDKTLMRNALSYTLAGQLGRYAPRVRFCELVINGEYMGVYLFTETIKRDNNRVDVTKMVPEDINEPEVSGGYIFKEDWTDVGDNVISLSRGMQLVITEPKSDSILPEQTSWLNNHLNEFENVLYSGGDYSAYIDLPSFVDNFLIVELTKNIDGYRLSTYFHKERGGKIVAAPVWDYNFSLGNADYFYGWTAAGWYWPIIQNMDRWNKNWWMTLNKEPQFQDLCKTRWTGFRTTVFSETHIFSLIDKWTELLTEAQQRNFVTYPILGTYLWPNPGFPESGSMGYNAPRSGGPTTWAEEIEQMKEFISARLVWMDENMPGKLSSNNRIEADHGDEDLNEPPFPNPFSSSCRISFKADKPGSVSIFIYDVLGKIIKSETVYSPGTGTAVYTWDGSGDSNRQAACAVYFYVIVADKQIINKGKLVKID